MTSDIAESLVRRCPVALSLHAERGHFQAASDECARVFARPREQLVGASLLALVDERDRDRVVHLDPAHKSRLFASGAACGAKIWEIVDDVWECNEAR